MHDVIVVGAGPAGSKTAELCSSLDLDVLLIEKNKKVGLPIQCTGLFSHRIIGLSGVERKLATNKINKARFYSPKGNFLELTSKKPVYVFDREKFDKELFKKAKKSGVKTKLNTKFIDYRITDDCLKLKTSKGNYQTKILIGADGPNSTVAKKSKIKLPDDVIVGSQQTLKGDFDSNTVELWFGKKIAPDFFGWVVPIDSESAKIGIGCRKNSSKYFRSFVKKRLGKFNKGVKIEGGIIRRGLIKDSVSDRVLLVGDAACQIKPYSGGGVIYGLISSRIASQACYKSITEKKFSSSFLKRNYDKKWKERLSPGIKKGFLIDKIVRKTPDWGLNIGTDISRYFRSWLERMDMDLI